MTYLVLARKWRPRSFDTLVGQDHVVRALTHALSTQRLHHAWLFTGTRGVGKTTLSRILAKSLNCETGITANPCGTCRACTEIDAGRFVDYVELDAASNRGVDEMTQLLEQAVYSPSSGRFKVYMIDEVHMLTGHAFNAMLKTLEEPPPHVKFILATTDPQKIPVTVLSRCLQFNLKQMTAQSIVEHLEQVLAEENMSFEQPALRLIAQAASGSMRDALSLSDQAIAYSAGNLTLEAMQGMLGTIDQRYLARLLKALAAGDGTQVLHVADELATRGLSYSGALSDLAVLLSQIAIQQRVPGALDAADPMADEIKQLASLMHPDLVQLFYSIAVHSRTELALAPDEYAGFVMACLRMLALAPEAEPHDEGGGGKAGASKSSSETGGRIEAAEATAPRAAASVENAASAQAPAAIQPVSVPEPAVAEPSAPTPAVQNQAAAEPEAVEQTRSEVAKAKATDVEVAQTETAHAEAVHADADETVEPAGVNPAGIVEPNPEAQSPASVNDIPPWEDIPLDENIDQFESYAYVDESAPDNFDDEFGATDTSSFADIPAELVAESAGFASERPKLRSPRLTKMDSKAWPALAAQLPVTGLAAELARQSEWLGVQDDQICLRVAVKMLAAKGGMARLRTVLSEHFGKVVQLEVEFGATGDETAHAVAEAERAARQVRAEQAVQSDPFVLALIDQFGAQVIPGSVQAIYKDRAA